MNGLDSDKVSTSYRKHDEEVVGRILSCQIGLLRLVDRERKNKATK